MSQTPYMQFYVADYLADTHALSAEQHGVYLLLLCTMWRNGGRLRNDRATLAKTGHISARRWDKISPDIIEKLTIIEGGAYITQKRLLAELEAAQDKVERLREAGAKGAKLRADKANSEAAENEQPGSSQAQATLKPGLSHPNSHPAYNQNQNQNIQTSFHSVCKTRESENQNLKIAENASQAQATLGENASQALQDSKPFDVARESPQNPDESTRIRQNSGQRESPSPVPKPFASEQLLAAVAAKQAENLPAVRSNSQAAKAAETHQIAAEFAEVFWPEYPNKVGKPAALKSFLTARKQADLPAIMAGLARYRTAKPPERQWLNPATFLNQNRWEDEPALSVIQPFGSSHAPPHGQRGRQGDSGIMGAAKDFVESGAFDRFCEDNNIK